MDQRITPTEIAHQELSRAFDALNAALFDGELPSCLITLQRGRASKGYFAAHRFIRIDAATTHEIAINPQIFALATLPEVLSEVAHNMCHCWAYVNGVGGRRGYHSTNWAKKMESIGLMPTQTGLPGGRKVGEKVEHYIVEGGRFVEVAQAMVRDGFNITWLDRVAAPWREGHAESEGRGHLLGEALLGKTGLLVDSNGEDDPDLDESPFGQAPREESLQGTTAPLSRDDGSAPHAHPSTQTISEGDDELDPWDRPLSRDDTVKSLHHHGASEPVAEQAQDGGQAPRTEATTDVRGKGRINEEPRPVPLIMRAGEDLDGKKHTKRTDKVRFSCPTCMQKAWAKGTAKLDCGHCKVAMLSAEPEPA